MMPCIYFALGFANGGCSSFYFISFHFLFFCGKVYGKNKDFICFYSVFLPFFKGSQIDNKGQDNQDKWLYVNVSASAGYLVGVKLCQDCCHFFNGCSFYHLKERKRKLSDFENVDYVRSLVWNLCRRNGIYFGIVSSFLKSTERNWVVPVLNVSMKSCDEWFLLIGLHHYSKNLQISIDNWHEYKPLD